MFWFAKIVASDWIILIVVQLQQDFLCLVSMNILIQRNFLNFPCEKLWSHLKLKLFTLFCWFYADVVKLLLTIGTRCLGHTLKYNRI